jgi:hypothetical protein
MQWQGQSQFPEFTQLHIQTALVLPVVRLRWNNRYNFQSHPLTYICNVSLFTGNFPVPLNYTKKEEITNMSNYRPITLLTIFFKVLKEVMHNSLSHYLQTNNILVPEQFGFRNGTSTESEVFKLTHNLLKSISQKNACWWNILWFGKSFWLCKSQH